MHGIIGDTKKVVRFRGHLILDNGTIAKVEGIVFPGKGVLGGLVQGVGLGV